MPLAQPGLVAGVLSSPAEAVSSREALSSEPAHAATARPLSLQSEAGEARRSLLEQGPDQGAENGLAGGESWERRTAMSGGVSSGDPGVSDSIHESKGGKALKEESHLGDKDGVVDGIEARPGSDTLRASWRSLLLGMGMKLFQEVSQSHFQF